MNFIGYIFIGIIILIFAAIYLLYVLTYLGTAKLYRQAERGTAVILEDLGDMRLKTGSATIGVPRYRTYHKYLVSFWVNGTEYTKEAELKNRKLAVGEQVEVRYEISRKGEMDLVSEAYLCWSREMAIGYTLGLILGIVLAVLKANDVI
ncbi:MAG: hypothetical protein IKY23_00640 [Lachnospiraceae bacterium]|nr:hypothetical protein [Lachnospiraceae bacterium]